MSWILKQIRTLALALAIPLVAVPVARAQMKATAEKLRQAQRNAAVHQQRDNPAPPELPVHAEAATEDSANRVVQPEGSAAEGNAIGLTAAQKDRAKKNAAARRVTAEDAAAERLAAERVVGETAADRPHETVSDTMPAAESVSAAAPEIRSPAFWRNVTGALIAGVLILLAAVALVLRLRAFEKSILGRLMRLDAALEKHGGAAYDQEKERRSEIARLNQEIRTGLESLRSMIGSTHAETQRLIARGNTSAQLPRGSTAVPESRQSAAAKPAYDTYDEPKGYHDLATQLLSIANRIVQQSSTTLEAFRASTVSLGGRVSAWPDSAESAPAAFIVEYHGSYYAVPNVVKPTRLPQEWFNRSEFGVNDEIQRVISLPRLRRRGDDYDVQEPGVFVR